MAALARARDGRQTDPSETFVGNFGNLQTLASIFALFIITSCMHISAPFTVRTHTRAWHDTANSAVLAGTLSPTLIIALNIVFAARERETHACARATRLSSLALTSSWRVLHQAWAFFLRRSIIAFMSASFCARARACAAPSAFSRSNFSTWMTFSSLTAVGSSPKNHASHAMSSPVPSKTALQPRFDGTERKRTDDLPVFPPC